MGQSPVPGVSSNPRNSSGLAEIHPILAPQLNVSVIANLVQGDKIGTEQKGVTMRPRTWVPDEKLQLDVSFRHGYRRFGRRHGRRRSRSFL